MAAKRVVIGGRVAPEVDEELDELNARQCEVDGIVVSKGTTFRTVLDRGIAAFAAELAAKEMAKEA